MKMPIKIISRKKYQKLKNSIHSFEDRMNEEFKKVSNLLDSDKSLTKKGKNIYFEYNNMKVFFPEISAEDGLCIINEIFNTGVYDFFTSKDDSYTMIDIGMNMAITSIYMAQDPKIKNIYSFEPFKPTFDIAMKNIKNNKLENKINAFNFGLADKDTSISLSYDPAMIGRMSSSNNEEKTGANSDIIELKNASSVLAPIFEENKHNKFFIKMDCEGAEYDIFPILDDAKILEKANILIMEWHKKDPTILVDTLLKNNFIVFKETEKEYMVGSIKAIKVK